MRSLENILLSMECKCRMNIFAPASKEDLLFLHNSYPSQYEGIFELYEISDGLEIGMPGTVFYPIRKIISTNKCRENSSTLEIGIMNFGDPIMISDDCRVIQIDHDSGEIFIEWDSLKDFMSDELNNLV